MRLNNFVEHVPENRRPFFWNLRQGTQNLVKLTVKSLGTQVRAAACDLWRGQAGENLRAAASVFPVAPIRPGR
jgi:hypothetical protein